MPNHLVLISGDTSTGKSSSLRNIANKEKVMYLCCESGKDLPFPEPLGLMHSITDPLHVYAGIKKAEAEGYHTVVIDSLTYLMDMYESTKVLTASNGMKAWSDYAQFFKNLMQEYIAKSSMNFIILAHTRSDVDEVTGDLRTAVPIKGALKNNGIESYFNFVVSTKRVKLNKLASYENDLLTVTPDDEIVGYKHVFQTRITKDTVNERIRTPIGLFSIEQSFIDNNVDTLLNHLDDYYKKDHKYFEVNQKQTKGK